jgi:hypothetical protein
MTALVALIGSGTFGPGWQAPVAACGTWLWHSQLISCLQNLEPSQLTIFQTLPSLCRRCVSPSWAGLSKGLVNCHCSKRQDRKLFPVCLLRPVPNNDVLCLLHWEHDGRGPVWRDWHVLHVSHASLVYSNLETVLITSFAWNHSQKHIYKPVHGIVSVVMKYMVKGWLCMFYGNFKKNVQAQHYYLLALTPRKICTAVFWREMGVKYCDTGRHIPVKEEPWFQLFVPFSKESF